MVAQRCPQGGSGEAHVRRAAFTMVELLIVILIIAVLVALLVPALAAAIRRARQAATTSEINVIATSLAQFKSAYGFFPPSRLYLSEVGLFPTGSTTQMTTFSGNPGSDMTEGQLAQRSLRYLQRMFPRVAFSTVGATMNGTTAWYDYNGNGKADADYVLQGHQCLVFFLGGVPIYDPGLGAFTGMGGWGKNPVNPFSNSIVGNPMVSLARTTPLMEFKNSRLVADATIPVANGLFFPGYYDQTNNILNKTSSSYSVNFYAYFSSYEGAGYDPNDVDFAEPDFTQSVPAVTLAFTPSFPVVGSSTTLLISPAPNPYTTSLSVAAGGTVSYQNPQSYQIISAGDDGFYGPGGQYSPNNRTAATPPDTVNTPYNSTDPSAVRMPEHDNLTNFANGPLG